MPSPEQVNRRQNFNRITNQHLLMKKLVMKKILAWSGGFIGASAIAAAVILNNVNSPEPAQPQQTAVAADTPSQTRCVSAPLPGKEEPYSTFIISAKDGGTIHYKTGSVITIPANAFVNKGAKPASDSITVRYREFHDPLGIFLSGIPMDYDSAGTAYTLESAGMLEILAFDGDQKLSLAPQKQIGINMASNTDETDFNLYELDTLAKNWVYKGKDKILAMKNNNIIADQKEKTIPAAPGNIIADEKTIRPAVSDPQKYCFKIGYDKNEFPELAAYDNVLFEVRDNTFKPAYYKINWKKISLENSDTEGLYNVKLKKADTTITVKAVPVFDADNYAAALAKFDAQQKQISSKQTKEENEKRTKLNSVNKDLRGYDRNQMLAVAKATGTRRVFMISQLGIHNCDRPIPPPPLQLFVQGLEKPEKKDPQQLRYNIIYLVEKGKNTVFRFMKGEPVKFDRDSEKLMWTVTDQNKIAFFRNMDLPGASGTSVKARPIIAKDQELALEEIRKFSE